MKEPKRKKARFAYICSWCNNKIDKGNEYILTGQSKEIIRICGDCWTPELSDIFFKIK